MSAQMESLDHHMEFQIIFETVTFCQFVLYVSKKNRSIPSLLASTFLKDPTDSDEHMFLPIFHGLSFQRFRWFLIGFGDDLS